MKSVFFKISCIFFLTILHFNLVSQVKIDVKIDDINDTILYLMKYKSDKTQSIIDYSSTSYNKKTFKNPQKYDEGIYVLTDSKQNPLFEILIGKDQEFSLYINDMMDLNTYKIKGSKETSDYFKVYSKTIHNTSCTLFPLILSLTFGTMPHLAKAYTLIVIVHIIGIITF